MSNLIRMELRRLFRSKCFYIFPGILVIITLINVIFGEKETGVKHISEVFSQSEGLLIATLCVAGIYAIYHLNKEYRKGFIKNIAGNVPGRHVITIGRLITGTVTVIVYTVLGILSSLVIMTVNSDGIRLVRDYPYAGNGSANPEIFQETMISPDRWESSEKQIFSIELGKYLLIVLAGIAVMALAVMLFELVRSSTLSYVIIVIIFCNLLEPLLYQFCGLIFPDFQLAKYLLISQNLFITYEASFENGQFLEYVPESPMWTFFVRTAIYLIVFTVSAIFISKKKDAV